MIAAGLRAPRRPDRRRTERGSAMHKLGFLLVALLLLSAVSTSIGWLPGLSGPTPGPRLAEPPALVPGVTLPAAHVPRPVLAHPSAAAQLDRSAVRRLLVGAVASKALSGHVEVIVGPLGAGRMLQLGATDPITPASLLKLLTLTAALEVLGPQHRFDTSVVRGHALSDVVLVGGGDPLLTAQPPRPGAMGIYPYPQPTSLVSLARRTAKQLATTGVRRVRLQYDESLFTGPAVNPAWRTSYLRDNVVSPISALWVDEGRAKPGYAPRGSDPAAAAAQRFADLLRASGITVARDITATRVPAGAVSLAHVESAPLSALVQHIVEVSDNEGAEVLLRQVAIATGHVGSAAAGVRAVRAALNGLGIDLSAVTFYDGSGLARSDAAPIRVLTDVLRLAASPSHPELHPLISALPVAGFTGSLAYRFTRSAQSGRGEVRAKTGTLTGVHGLAGIVSTADGQALVFAAVADHVPVRRTLAARAELDRIAALLATCGCGRS